MEFFQTYGSTILMVGGLILVFVLMWRSNKKQERETQDMRNSLEVGDEITTIGGIIGEIIRIKEETVTIETGKDRTKIRILRSAVRSVDVHAFEKRGETKKVEAKKNDANDSEISTENKKQKKSKIKPAKLKAEENVEVVENAAEIEAETEETKSAE